VDRFKGSTVDNRKLFLGGEVVTNVAVVQREPGTLRILDPDRGSNSCAPAVIKNIARFLPALFTSCACVAPQVEHIQVREILRHREAHTIAGVAIDPSAVGYKSHDTVGTESVDRPPECT